MNTVEERLASLEKENKKMKHELDRAQAYIEISNLMSRYEYWHAAGQHDKKGKYIAQKTPGARMEFLDSGVFEGNEKARMFMVDLHNLGLKDHPEGIFQFHSLTTPIIEVAGDGKTARGLWLSPGFETLPTDDKPLAVWVWELYAADFVKEDGVWKWLRIHLHRGFVCPYDKSWVDIDVGEFYKSHSIDSSGFPPELRPDRPTTYFNMYSLNDPCCWTKGIPPAPESYETYEEWMAVVEKAD
jgi:hypothetical protein